MLKVTTAQELVALGKDERGRMRYSTQEMLQAEQALLLRTRIMAGQVAHGVSVSRQASALSQSSWATNRKRRSDT